MAARGGTVLPSRAIDRRGSFLTRGSAGHQMGMGTALVVGGALMIVFVLSVPRPDIVLTNPQFFPVACDVENGTRTVIATFTLTNRGGISGAMQVNFYADSTMLSSDVQFEVPAKASIRGTLSGVVHDCASHAYSLSASYPSGTL